MSLTKGAVIEACALGSSLNLSQTIFPFSAMAAEQSDVEVSMRIILSITS